MRDFATWELLVLTATGAVATAINTLAGGGSLVSFPVLVALGVPPIAANATNTFALTLGGVSGALGFRSSLPRVWRHLVRFAAPTLTGAAAGAWLLLHTTQRLFDLIVPALLAVATALLALRSLLRARPGQAPWVGLALLAPVFIFAISVYGGYFGAGMGIVFLAALDWFIPDSSLHDHNAIKNWLQCLVNIVAAGIFLAQGTVLIVPGVALMLGGLVGGYASALLSQRLDPRRLRMGVVAYGGIMTVWFTAKVFWHA